MQVDLDEGESIDVQMAPLIDCVFLLLIFFLLATTLKKIQKELPLELPDSAAAIEVREQDDTLVISVDREGRLHLGAEPVTTKELHEHLRNVARTDPHRRVRIDGDQVTRLQHVVHVLDLCQFEGLKNVAIRTKRERKGSSY